MEETTTTEHHVPAPDNNILLSTEAQYYLNEGAGWAKFLGITGFIFCGLLLIFAVFAGSFFASMARLAPSQVSNPYNGVVGTMVGSIYGVTAVLYFFPCLYLFQFGNKIKNGLAFANDSDVTTGIGKLKSFFKFVGILTIISLAFMALGIIGLVIGMAGLHGMRQ